MRIKQRNEDWRVQYDAFLKSPEWAAKRALVLKRANHTCESCLTARASQVHHLHYPPTVTHDTLTHQTAWSLRAVCDACHRRIHNIEHAQKETRITWGK